MRGSRKYNKRVEVWQTVPTKDEFNDYTDVDTKITTIWARLETLKNFTRETDNGIIDSFKSIWIYTRHRKDFKYNSLNMYFKYQGLKYIIQNDPINEGFYDTEVKILAVRQSVKEANELAPINVNVFDTTFDNTFN